MSSASFAKLLADQGDATVFLPRVAPFPPAPTPTPVPTPTPTPTPVVIPADVLNWARRVVGEVWRSKTDRHIAQEILNLAGQ